MATKLTDRIVRELSAPPTGNRVQYDAERNGFGLRITAAGARAFVLRYRAAGRERMFTIGGFPDWTVSAAREKARELRRAVDSGADPMSERAAVRTAPTFNDLADRFEAEHLGKRRVVTATGYKSILKLHLRPALGRIKVADLRHADVERMHSAIATTAPYQANRAVAILSKMLNLAVKWELRNDNPARGVERAPEQRRERFLDGAEIARLADVLAAHPERVSCAAIRMLLLTGARKGELLSATWTQFDLAAGVWTKPSASTKQSKEHRVPLSAPALAVLNDLRADADPLCSFVFPGKLVRAADGVVRWQHLTEIKKVWLTVCRKAGLAQLAPQRDVSKDIVKGKDGKPVMVWQTTARLHDLRHSYASILASSGLSLPVIGALLGHTQAATTQRYAHLLDDPLRAATERVGAFVTGAGKEGAVVVPLRRTQ